MPPWLVQNPRKYSTDGGEIRKREILSHQSRYAAADPTDLILTSYLRPVLQYGVMLELTLYYNRDKILS